MNNTANGTITRRELDEMPFDKVFETKNGNEEFCHATGWEVNFEDPAAPDFWQWWYNEYKDSEGNLYYGR